MVFLEVRAFKADARRVEQRLALVEQADDHGLTVDGGQRVDTQVDVLLLEANVRAAVLRYAALGRVHATHDFQARDDGRLQFLRHGEDGAQHAVDAHTHMQVGFARLEVNIACTLGCGALDDAVHEAHGGSGLRVGVVAERRGLERAGGGIVRAGRAHVALHFLDGAGGAFVAVQRHDGTHEGILRGHHGNHAFARGVLHRLDGHEVQRVAHGEVHFFGRRAHRHHVVLPRDVFGNDATHLGVEVRLRQVDEFHAQLHLQRLDEARFRDDVLGDKLVAQTSLRHFLLFEGVSELLIRDEARIDQHVTQAFVGHLRSYPLHGHSGISKRFSA